MKNLLFAKRSGGSMVALLALGCSLPALTWAAEPARVTSAPITLNRTKQLFLDDYLIARADNVRRITHPARKFAGNPVLWDDGAGGDVTYGSVIREQGKYRMWYARGRMVSYAEGADGDKFAKPTLDFVKIDGEKTNVLFASDRRNIGTQSKLKYEGPEIQHFSQLSGVVRATHTNDPAERYLMGFISIQPRYKGPREDPHHPGERRGFGVATSADGYTWKLVNNWATETYVDGPTYWLWDGASKKYIHYGRAKLIAPGIKKLWGLDGLPQIPMSPAQHTYLKSFVWGRAVSRAETPDFASWDYMDVDKSPVILTADTYDPPGAEMYAMQVFAYEGIYIGLIKVWRRSIDHAGPFDIQLATSRDGRAFERVGERQPIISEGDVGEWDRFNTSTFMNDPIVVGDDLRIYYSAQAGKHAPYKEKDSGPMGAGVGYASVRRDRFVSLASSFDGGTVLTKPLRVEGRNLRLNAKADFGTIVVEALDASGAVVAKSKPWSGDKLDSTIEWESGNLPSGEPVVLRIELKNAHLYSVWSS